MAVKDGITDYRKFINSSH